MAEVETETPVMPADGNNNPRNVPSEVVPRETSFSAAMMRAFDETIESALQDLSIFTVLAKNIDSVAQRSRVALLTAMVGLVFFLMVVLPALVFWEDIDKIKCKSNAKFKSRLAAFALILYLQLTMFSTMIEARVLMYFSNIGKTKRSRRVLAFGAISKVMCGATVLLATYALFLLNPKLSDLLLNSIALNFLLEVDQQTMRVFKNSLYIVSMYNKAVKDLREDYHSADAQGALYQDLFEEIVSLRQSTYPEMIRAFAGRFSKLWRKKDYLMLAFTASVTFLIAAGLFGTVYVCYCLPKASQLD